MWIKSENVLESEFNDAKGQVSSKDSIHALEAPIEQPKSQSRWRKTRRSLDAFEMPSKTNTPKLKRPRNKLNKTSDDIKNRTETANTAEDTSKQEEPEEKLVEKKTMTETNKTAEDIKDQDEYDELEDDLERSLEAEKYEEAEDFEDGLIDEHLKARLKATEATDVTEAEEDTEATEADEAASLRLVHWKEEDMTEVKDLTNKDTEQKENKGANHLSKTNLKLKRLNKKIKPVDVKKTKAKRFVLEKPKKPLKNKHIINGVINHYF